MPQTVHRDIEGGEDSGPDGHLDQAQSMSNQPTPPNQPLLPLQGESEYGDGSWPLYSMYSKIAEKDDNKIVEHCQKDADGILIFSGLFSAMVGALLTVSISDLKPNSQDTSAFYLEKIYHLYGNTNVSHPLVTSSLAKPPAFSPPTYAIWVNSLWILSLAVNLSSAMMATEIRNWAVYYIGLTQWPWDTPAKQARIRAIFAKGNPGPYIIWGTGDESIYLHFSILLFVAGGLIYLFNINRAVFYAVVSWVGYIAILYAGATVAVFFESHNLLHTPLSPLALRIYLGISYVVVQICSYIPPLHGLRENKRRRYDDLSNRFSKGLLIGKRKAVEEIASKPSSEVDALILERILVTLDEDHTLEMFFEAIPGFCNSKLSVLPLSDPVQSKLQQALYGFLDRTFSSSLISETIRTGRFVTCLNTVHAALGPHKVSGVLNSVFNGHWDGALQSVEIGHALRLWGHSRDHDLKVRRIVACIIARVRRRDDRWIMLVKEAFGVPDSVFLDCLAHGDSALLSILIHISRETSRAGSWTSGILSSLSKFDIRNTLPGLQHDFCTLWNELVQEATVQGHDSIPVKFLREIRHLYIALHELEGTDASPTTFSASTPCLDPILLKPSSYPFCDIASHRPDLKVRVPVSNSCTGPFPMRPSDLPDSSPSRPDPGLSTTNEIGKTSQALTATFPVHSGSPSSDIFPQGGAATAPPDTTSAAKLSHPPECNKQQGLAIPYEAPLTDISQTVPTPATAPSSTPTVLIKSPQPPHVPPWPNEEFLSLIGGSSPKGSSDNATPPCLRASRIVNDGKMCPANAVLQVLVYFPPFRDLFKDTGQLVGQRKGEETGGGATPLIDAMVRFLEEYANKEKSSLSQQVLQQATRDKAREDEEDNEEVDGMDPFMPTYVYDAMKQKRQFINMRDGQEQDATEFLGLYLEALDEELVALHTSVSAPKPASIQKVEELEEETRSGEGQTEVRERNYIASSAESAISRIFNGSFCSTVRAPNLPDAVTVQDWRLLQLNIQPDSVHTVKDALAHISQPQPLQVSQSGQSAASQQVQIQKLPSGFVLHLKRFLHDVSADGITKIIKPVQFSPELEIPLEIMTPVAGKYVEPVHYKLYGVIYHHGESGDSGHYTVDVLHPNGGGGGGEGWLNIGNDAVSAVQHEDVFRGHDNERRDDRCAYMLFYCRTASAQT